MRYTLISQYDNNKEERSPKEVVAGWILEYVEQHQQ